MNTFNLHYASLHNDGDIPCFKFQTHSNMLDFIDEICIGKNGEKVWLIGKDNYTDIFISESHLSIQNFLEKKYTWQTTGDYFLQEYSSFKEAYKVALYMCEISPLCY